jgi:hypothetical protein
MRRRKSKCSIAGSSSSWLEIKHLAERLSRSESLPQVRQALSQKSGITELLRFETAFFFKFWKRGVEIALNHELATRAPMGTLKRQHQR